MFCSQQAAIHWQELENALNHRQALLNMSFYMNIIDE
jgi:hypothetical protein